MKDSFVVIQLANTQFIVSEGDVVDVPRMEGKIGDEITIDDVFLKVDSDKAEVGTPSLTYTVKAEIIDQYKAKKIDVYKFKAKSRYRRKFGHRQPMTKVKIGKITKSKVAKAKKEPTAAKKSK